MGIDIHIANPDAILIACLLTLLQHRKKTFNDLLLSTFCRPPPTLHPHGKPFQDIRNAKVNIRPLFDPTPTRYSVYPLPRLTSPHLKSLHRPSPSHFFSPVFQPFTLSTYSLPPLTYISKLLLQVSLSQPIKPHPRFRTTNPIINKIGPLL